MSFMPFSYSADFHLIDIALKSRWEPFKALAQEMDAFEPRPLSDFDDERMRLTSQLKAGNPGVSIDKIEEMVNMQISGRATLNSQFREQFASRFVGEYVTVVLLSQALSEAAINAILALGLTYCGLQNRFPDLQRESIRRKWQEGPKAFLPTWSFPEDDVLYQTLDELIKVRNCLTHYKITVSRFGENEPVIKGSSLESRSYAEDSAWLRRFFSLPYDLADYAIGVIQNRTPPLILNRGQIERASQHF